ncbi:hypothetical protein DCAR_0934430 [Daucus carota subsp. sativus]|uniref:Uncharacterized protein n=1 Tax=Daucus carota subsp. sativus TaxID=79200 RepID=A0AAF1BFF4_DAUCS|nr:PREDICTED: inner centromere protein B-like [Daucus carota subsp. sativus]WOH14902.1 hypothetical protein DCAR_0934430 [Daucus carota subsp. sativus]
MDLFQICESFEFKLVEEAVEAGEKKDLFYVDRVWIKIETEVFRTIPRFTAWSDKDLRARKRKETSENLFGKGRIRSVDESTEQTQEVARNVDEERKREQMIVELENLAFILVESRKQFDAANIQFNKCLKSCIDYNTVNNNEEAARKDTEETSQHNFEPLGNPVEETIGTTNKQFDTSIQQGAEVETSKINDPVSEEREVEAEKQVEEERQVEKERTIEEAEEEREVEAEKEADGAQKEIEEERPVEKTVSPVQSSKEIEQEKPVENIVSPVQSSMGSEVLRMVDDAEKDYQKKIMAQEMASNVNVVGIATEAVSGLQDERTSDTEIPVAEHKASEQEQAAQEALDVSSRKAA